MFSRCIQRAKSKLNRLPNSRRSVVSDVSGTEHLGSCQTGGNNNLMTKFSDLWILAAAWSFVLSLNISRTSVAAEEDSRPLFGLIEALCARLGVSSIVVVRSSLSRTEVGVLCSAWSCSSSKPASKMSRWLGNKLVGCSASPQSTSKSSVTSRPRRYPECSSVSCSGGTCCSSVAWTSGLWTG